MQTFLPYGDYTESARVLDNKRLHKQTVETYQILLQLLSLRPVRVDDAKGKPTVTIGFEPPEVKYLKSGKPRVPGWGKHPMLDMWRGHEYALAQYQRACCAHLYTRPTVTGKPRSIKVERLTNWALYHAVERGFELNQNDPEWLGRDDLHASHRSALLWKAPEWYSQWGWTETPAYEYVWPVPTP